ncbi:hypothetical protein PM10SUCC1_04910 [Propionigenium maris DSM 9537]|uniref:Uncharacterized protein n=1 Tax=Propionigenium maris DSM 9537 TaxID=1123000 RepID=A0A9W6LL59_9FUSO|nr:hypothetical protein [Propionigenium maris]GLI54976.1 hypothetical protein PM10SUCC1_04910 [Propionigenium maris DSM 9537]
MKIIPKWFDFKEKEKRNEMGKIDSVKRLENILLVEKLEIRGSELLSDIRRLEKKNSQKIEDSLDMLLEKNDLLLEKAKNISDTLKKMEREIIKNKL